MDEEKSYFFWYHFDILPNEDQLKIKNVNLYFRISSLLKTLLQHIEFSLYFEI